MLMLYVLIFSGCNNLINCSLFTAVGFAKLSWELSTWVTTWFPHDEQTWQLISSRRYVCALLTWQPLQDGQGVSQAISLSLSYSLSYIAVSGTLDLSKTLSKLCSTLLTPLCIVFLFGSSFRIFIKIFGMFVLAGTKPKINSIDSNFLTTKLAAANFCQKLLFNNYTNKKKKVEK